MKKINSNIIGYVSHESGLTLVVQDGSVYNVTSDHPEYDNIISSVEANNMKHVVLLINKLHIQLSTIKNKRIYIQNGKVWYIPFENYKDSEKTIEEFKYSQGLDDVYLKEIHGTLVDKILEDVSNNQNVESLLNFLDNLQSNESRETRDELYDFLQSGKISITPDGCFLAYKKVRADFMDIYTGKMSNKPGNTLMVDKNLVDKNRQRTCSFGLHFCSLDYLQYYGTSDSNTVVIVKVNPKDVMAIPVDYNFTKGRACKYEVVGEYTGDYKIDAFNSNFINEKNKDKITSNIKWNDEKMTKENKHSFEQSLLIDGKLSVYRLEIGDKPKAVKFDLDGKPRDAKTGRFIPKTAKITLMLFKSYKDAIR